MASALGLVARIRVAQEALWLLAAFLVPLAVVSPDYMIGDSLYSYAQIPKATLLRTVAALMAVLWAVEWVAGVGSPRSYASRNTFHRAASWVRDEPARWVVVAAAFLMAVTVVSALLSPVPRVSLLGEPESFGGYSLYMMLSYVVLFLVVATHMKARPQVIRMLWAISAAGFLVACFAVVQHYDAGPLGFVGLRSGERPGSTLGNPIFAAAVLMLTVPVTLAAVLVATEERRNRLHTVPWIAALSVQLLGMIFTLSRGPWVGLTVTLLAFLGLAWYATDRTRFYRAAILVGLSLSVALAVAFLPVGRSDSAGGTGSESVAERFTSIGTEVGGGLSGRIGIWADSWNLIISRPWFGFEDPAFSAIRPLFGYGPDLYRYTYLLESRPRSANRIPWETGHAHNMFIQQAVELGVLGLVSWLGLLGAVFWVGLVKIRVKQGRKRAVREEDAISTWVLVALVSLMAGRVVEQMVGVARIADFTLFWVLLGAFVALPQVVEGGERSLWSGPPEDRADLPARSATLRKLLASFAVSLVVVWVGWLTWNVNLGYAWAAVDMGKASRALDGQDTELARKYVSRAASRAPNMSLYHLNKANLVSHRLRSADTAERTVFWANQAYLSSSDALRSDPLSFRARYALAGSAVTLATLQFRGEYIGDPEKAAEALRLYRETTQMVPGSWPLYNARATAYLRVGQAEGALEPLAHSLSLTGQSRHAAAAWYLRGLAHALLGRYQDAIHSFGESIRLDTAGGYADQARRQLETISEIGYNVEE